MKIDYQYINRDFNRKTTDFLLEIEFNMLKEKSQQVFNEIEGKRLPILSVMASVRELYLKGNILFVYITIWIVAIMFSFFDSSYIPGLAFLVLFGWTIRMLFAFKESYNSEKNRQYYERYYYELHNEIVKISSSYEDYLLKYEEQKLEGKLAWRPNI
jgi:hypothetical protein